MRRGRTPVIARALALLARAFALAAALVPAGWPESVAAARLPATPAPARQPVATTRAAPRLLDSFLPAAHFRDTHTEHIRATPRQVFAAVHAVTPGEVRGLVPLMRVRRGWWLTPREEALTRRPMLEGMAHEEVLVLGERFGDELVVGAIGRFWEDNQVAFGGAHGFREFGDPRYAKLAMNVTARDDGAGGSVVTTETRVRCDDADARRSFERYWNVGRPGTDALRDEWFRAVRRRAEAAASARHGS